MNGCIYGSRKYDAKHRDILVSTEASTDNAKQTTMAFPTISMAEVKESCF